MRQGGAAIAIATHSQLSGQGQGRTWQGLRLYGHKKKTRTMAGRVISRGERLADLLSLRESVTDCAKDVPQTAQSFLARFCDLVAAQQIVNLAEILTDQLKQASNLQRLKANSVCHAATFAAIADSALRLMVPCARNAITTRLPRLWQS
jgi:hypothetical protein